MGVTHQSAKRWLKKLGEGVETVPGMAVYDGVWRPVRYHRLRAVPPLRLSPEKGNG